MITKDLNKFDKDRYYESEKFASVGKINALSFALLMPLYIIGVSVYLLYHDYANIFATFFKATFILEIIILAAGVFVIMGAAILAKAVILSAFAPGGFDAVKFKIIKETQKPYCCLTEPVKVRQYRLASVIYILIMGVMPYIISLMVGDFIFVLASFVCVYFTASDIWLVIFLASEKNGSYILDFDGIMLYRIYEIYKTRESGGGSES
ncbi:MAG: hypothetical protein FWH10_07355 [Oscillospiraceae bacterium]|nr:hypothetical protein [Oscillospiraceae bacterium]